MLVREATGEQHPDQDLANGPRYRPPMCPANRRDEITVGAPFRSSREKEASDLPAASLDNAKIPLAWIIMRLVRERGINDDDDSSPSRLVSSRRTDSSLIIAALSSLDGFDPRGPRQTRIPLRRANNRVTIPGICVYVYAYVCIKPFRR